MNTTGNINLARWAELPTARPTPLRARMVPQRVTTCKHLGAGVIEVTGTVRLSCPKCPWEWVQKDEVRR